MEQHKFSFELYGTTIRGLYAQTDKVRGLVVLVHGFGEHSWRYLDDVIPRLLQASMAVVTYDNIGHGISGGKRGHCPSYGALLDILDTVIVKARSLFPKVPLFLYGHSMGGNLVLNYALKNNIELRGIVATSPYLRLAFQPPKWKMALGKTLLHLIPSMTMPSGLDPNGISRIHEEVSKYIQDPLVHDKVSPMFSFPIMDAGEWAISHAHQLQVDTLLLHGADDPIIDFRGTQAFHENSQKTTLEIFDGGYHELHKDLCKDQMLECIENWLRLQL